MRSIKLDLDCGEFTCASEPGKFCSNFGSIKFGQVSVCRLFPSDDKSYTILSDKDGWSQRCNNCLKSESMLYDSIEQHHKIYNFEEIHSKLSDQDKEYFDGLKEYVEMRFKMAHGIIKPVDGNYSIHYSISKESEE